MKRGENYLTLFGGDASNLWRKILFSVLSNKTAMYRPPEKNVSLVTLQINKIFRTAGYFFLQY